MKQLTKILLPLTLVLATASAQASTTVINFAGLNTGSIGGQGGWSVSNFPDRANVVAGGLSYSKGAVVHPWNNGGDNKLQIISGNQDGDGVNIGEARASIGIPTINAGETFYFSFLHNHNATERNFFYFAFSNGAADDNRSISAVGQNVNVDGAQQPRLRSRVRDAAGGQTATNGTAAHDLGNFTTNLIVGQVFFGGNTANSTIKLWLNPTSLTEAGNAESTHINAGRNIGITELNTLWIRGDGGAGGEFFIDQIMIGNSWEAVVIPEPSTYAALFGLLALGFVAWRRRQK